MIFVVFLFKVKLLIVFEVLIVKEGILYLFCSILCYKDIKK